MSRYIISEEYIHKIAFVCESIKTFLCFNPPAFPPTLFATSRLLECNNFCHSFQLIWPDFWKKIIQYLCHYPLNYCGSTNGKISRFQKYGYSYTILNALRVVIKTYSQRLYCIIKEIEYKMKVLSNWSNCVILE